MPPELPRAVVARQASRGHRLHHFLWHETRNRWLLPEEPNGLTDAVKLTLHQLGWEPPRPALNAQGRPMLDNFSGEDFLYMHRQMIGRVNDQLRQIGDPGYPRIEGWREIPAPGDTDYPVPPAWYITTIDDAERRRQIVERLQTVKSDDFFHKHFRFWERQFGDPVYLRGMSLGELGARLEFTIHNQLHNRFSAQPFGDRPDPEPNPTGSIPTAWDDPRYDYLGDTYSSHVHSVFWKVHGWVDDRIEDWRYANGAFGPIVWQGTWEGVRPVVQPAGIVPAGHGDHPPPGQGPPGHDPGHGHGQQDMERMEEAVRALGACPGRYGFLELGWVLD